jgi:GTPase SAR1 family protein
MLFDISNRDSFDNLDLWLEDIKAAARSDVVFILIDNKSDLESQRQVQAEEANDYAQRTGMTYFEVSAKTGANVANAVNCCVALIEKAIQKNAPPPPAQPTPKEGCAESGVERRHCC